MSEKTYRVGLIVVLICICVYWATKSKIFAGLGAMLFFVMSLIEFHRRQKEKRALKWAKRMEEEEAKRNAQH